MHQDTAHRPRQSTRLCLTARQLRQIRSSGRGQLKPHVQTHIAHASTLSPEEHHGPRTLMLHDLLQQRLNMVSSNLSRGFTVRSPVGIKKDRPRRFATLPRSHNAGSSPSLCQPALRFYTTTRLQVAILQQKMLHARRFVVFLETFFMKSFFMPTGLLEELGETSSSDGPYHHQCSAQPLAPHHPPPALRNP